MNDFWINFLANFFSDLIVGVAIGSIIAILISKKSREDTALADEKKIRKQTKEHRKKILTLIHKELRLNKKLIGTGPTDINPSEDFKYYYSLAHLTKTELWEAFSDGGEIQWINSVYLVDSIATTYYWVNAIQYSSRSIIQEFYYKSSGYGLKIGKKNKEVFIDNIAFVRDSINESLSLIESDLPELRKKHSVMEE